MTKVFHWDDFAKYAFEVPFRCFLPKGIDNLILTGASLSFDYRAIFMVMPNFPWCTQNGEIAGFAPVALFDFLGTLFLRALKMVIVPLLAGSIITGVAGLIGSLYWFQGT